MIILNYAHPLLPEHRARLQELAGTPIDEVRTLPAQLDLERPFAEQAAALADATGLDPEAWQTTPLLILLPSLNFAAAALLAELHGRMGYFPSIVRTRPVEGALPPRYEIAEILNLQAIRARAREKR